MTLEEFEGFLESEKSHLEWNEDEEYFYFRDMNYPYYQDSAERAMRVRKETMKDLSVEDLKREMVRGLNVEHITRVTGYYSKTSHFNAGKRGELRDRDRTAII